MPIWRRRSSYRCPPFALVQLDEALVCELPKEWRSIGSLPAFGSCEQVQVTWLEPGMCHLVPPELQRQVVTFDWWVRNADRLCSNTNLLWNIEHQSLVMIDHNLAFDRQFDAVEFSTQHVFADQWSVLASDLVEQANHAEWLHSALGAATHAVAAAPEEWLRSRNHLPQAVLFALRPPESDDAQRHDAYQEICADFQGLEVQTVLDSAISDIAAFAQS